MKVEEYIQEYARRYSAGDIDAVTDMCLWPFLAVREGAPNYLGDREATRDHFSRMIDTYRAAGFASFAPVEMDVRALGKAAAFVTVRWHVLGADGQVLRDSQTTYHLLADGGTWRMLSYTNHF